MTAHAIPLAGAPVLCIDTCSILDIMRDPTRETAQPHDRRAAIHLVTAAEAGDLQCYMADQVAIEFSEHDQPVQDEAARNLKKLRQQLDRINKLVAVYGATSVVDLSHLDDHVARARAVVNRWLVQLRTITPSAEAPAKAFARMNAGIAPARRGKDSSKDCLVYETVLEQVSALRSAGVTVQMVFLSSNTNEYLTEGKNLKPKIAVEFANFNLVYAPNMGAAKYALGL
jgi:DNA-binding FrmR family transcriptional regulator